MAAGIINLQKASGGITKISSADGTGVTELVVPESGNLVSVDTTVTDNAIARYDGTTGKLQNSGVFINDGGSVGIGLANPHANLGVNHNAPGSTGANNDTVGCSIAIDSAAVAVNPILGLRWTYDRVGIGGNSYSSQLVANSENNFALEMYTTGNSPLVFGTNSTERIRIDASGNLLLKSETGALGYGAGAGGTVTQLTSKYTAVTLNKPCGRIIMNNEALAAGARAIFSVNNSLVTNRDLLYCFIDDPTVGDIYSVLPWYVTDGIFYLQVKSNYPSLRSDTFAIKFVIIKGATA